jgi:hypothetical protein
MANPADPAGWPGNLVDPLKPDQKLGCDPLIIFYFYQNDIVLIYKKNWGWPDRNPWHRPWGGSTTEPSLKTLITML